MCLRVDYDFTLIACFKLQKKSHHTDPLFGIRLKIFTFIVSVPTVYHGLEVNTLLIALSFAELFSRQDSEDLEINLDLLRPNTYID